MGKTRILLAMMLTALAALPTWAYGTFDGGLLAKGQPNGLATLTLSAVGKLSGKLQKDGLSWTVSAASFADWEVADESEELVFFAEAICKSGKLVETNLLGVVRASLADGTTVGRIGFVTDEEEPVPEADVDAQQNLWKTEPWKTLGKAFANKTIEIEPGVTLKTAASGAVSATGKFVTGQDARGKDVVYSASCSTVLLPFGDGTYEVYLHFPPKSGKFEGRSACVRLAWNQEAQAWQLDD